MYNPKKLLKEVKGTKKGEKLVRDVKNIVDDEFSKEFWELYPKFDKVPLSPILYNFNKYLGSIILSTRGGIRLPSFMGFMFVISFKKKDNRVNIKLTQAEQRPCTYTNMETDGYQCRVMFITSRTVKRFKNLRYWGFDPSLEFKKDLSIEYPKRWKIFAVVNNPLFSSNLVTTSFQRSYAERMNKERLKEYDPFKWD